MYFIGIDVGSTYTKYCIMDEREEPLTLFSERTPVRQQEYFRKKEDEFSFQYPECHIVSCGYGRNNIVSGEQKINELSALAVGANKIIPGIPVVLDIGGQDTKVICQEHGHLCEFYVNQKCAAGCGLFLKNTLNMLDMSFNDFEVSERESDYLRLSSVCAVFAQTEIVDALAVGIPEKEIVQAVLLQIFTQARKLLDKMPGDRLVFSGGLTEIKGIQTFAQKILGRSVVIPKAAKYLPALGCALLAEEKHKPSQEED